MLLHQGFELVLAVVEALGDLLDRLPLGGDAGFCLLHGCGAGLDAAALRACPALPDEEAAGCGEPGAKRRRGDEGRAALHRGGQAQVAHLALCAHDQLVVTKQSVPAAGHVAPALKHRHGCYNLCVSEPLPRAGPSSGFAAIRLGSADSVTSRNRFTTNSVNLCQPDAQDARPNAARYASDFRRSPYFCMNFRTLGLTTAVQ